MHEGSRSLQNTLVRVQALCLLFEELQLYGGSLVTPRSPLQGQGGVAGGGKHRHERRKALEDLVAHHVRAADQVLYLLPLCTSCRLAMKIFSCGDEASYC